MVPWSKRGLTSVAAEWAFQNDGLSPKHHSMFHPLFSATAGVACALAVGHMSSVVLPDPSHVDLFSSPVAPRLWAAYALLVYTAFLIFSRVMYSGWFMLYEALWACNIAMILAGVGLLYNRPCFVGMALCTVVMDQLLWYIDIVGYLLFRRFPIGVAKYITWPETPVIKKISSTHHLWFVFLCTYWLLRWGPGLPLIFFSQSIPITATLISTAGMLTPCDVHISSSVYHLNVNLSHKCWKDIKKLSPILLWWEDGPWIHSIAWRLLIWKTGDAFFFAILLTGIQIGKKLLMLQTGI